MDTYTAYCNLRQPAAAKWNWHPDWFANQIIIDILLKSLLSTNKVVSGGLVTQETNDVVEVATGEVFLAGAYNEFLSSPVFLTPAPAGEVVQHFVYVDSTGNVLGSETAPIGDHCLLAIVDTDENGIFQIADVRAMGYGDPTKPRESGIDFTTVDINSGIFTFAHGLNVNYPASVVIWDEHKQIIQPDEVTSIDANTVAVDISSFYPITGTWHISIRG